MVNKARVEIDELVLSVYKHANGYVGSSMLTNTEFSSEKIRSARVVAATVLEYNLKQGLYTEGWYKELVEALEKLDYEVCESCDTVFNTECMKMDTEYGNWFCPYCVVDLK